jgi:hypothetical protein
MNDLIKYRYLIKHQGVWKILETWASKPDWEDAVTDVIWLKNPMNMTASWWQMKDGKRYQTYLAREEELTILLLQAERC